MVVALTLSTFTVTPATGRPSRSMILAGDRNVVTSELHSHLVRVSANGLDTNRISCGTGQDGGG